MSLKVATVSKLIQQPQTNDKFVLFCPELPEMSWVGQRTTLPFDERGVLSVPVPGTDIKLPGRLKNGGVWTVELTENFVPYVSVNLQVAKRMQVRRELVLGHEHHFTWVNIMITDTLTGLVPLFWYTMKNVWIQKVEPLNLNWQDCTTPQTYKVTFCYSEAERSYLPDRNSGPDSLLGKLGL